MLIRENTTTSLVQINGVRSTVKQMMKLRQLVMTQITAQSTYLADEKNQKVQVRAKVDEWLRGDEGEFPRYQAGDERGVGRVGR